MTREEAIEVVRKNLPHLGIGATEMTDALGTLIPELRESEDERIRKELKEAFEAYDIESKWNGIPIRSIFAWLEKQKEKSEIPIMPTPPSGWGCDGTHCTNPQMDCINCPRKTTGGTFSTSSASGTSTLKEEGTNEQLSRLVD